MARINFDNKLKPRYDTVDETSNGWRDRFGKKLKVVPEGGGADTGFPSFTAQQLKQNFAGQFAILNKEINPKTKRAIYTIADLQPKPLDGSYTAIDSLLDD